MCNVSALPINAASAGLSRWGLPRGLLARLLCTMLAALCLAWGLALGLSHPTLRSVLDRGRGWEGPWLCRESGAEPQGPKPAAGLAALGGGGCRKASAKPPEENSVVGGREAEEEGPRGVGGERETEPSPRAQGRRLRSAALLAGEGGLERGSPARGAES